ncbi:hypothetical protein RYH80_10815 [Halobaculum sp. MBLA0147]|uniref:DUF7409 domain-containing protein n=1 Tax=Halobaculum sp. MBLA0147 TaxID=3079934 RepID=UPI003525C566
MTADADTDEPEPTALKFVGPATAERLADAAFGAAEIAAREVSFNMLRAAGVNPGVAAKIRREHSLPWSFETEDSDGDLDRRSTQVRGLGDGERAWVAASEGDWDDPANAPDGAATTPTDEDGGGSPTVSFETGESEWPEPATPAGVETADGTGLDGPPTAADRHGDESDDGIQAGVEDGPAADDAETGADGSPGDTAGTERGTDDPTVDDGAATDTAWPDTARPDTVVTVEEADAVGEWPETARPEGVATADDTDGPGADAAWPAVVGGVSTEEAESDESDETERRTNGTAQADGAGGVVDTTTDGPVARNTPDDSVTDDTATDDSVTDDTATDDTATDDSGTDDTTPDESGERGESADGPAEEPAWQTRSSPTPLSVLDEVDETTQRRLATAGITSLRALATADPDAVAGALGLEPERLATLRAAARRYTE